MEDRAKPRPERSRTAAFKPGNLPNEDNDHFLAQVVVVGKRHSGTSQPGAQEWTILVEEFLPVAFGRLVGKPPEPGQRSFHVCLLG
jgi:hypothetical protein